MDIAMLFEAAKSGVGAVEGALGSFKTIKELMKKPAPRDATFDRQISEQLVDAHDQMLRVKEAQLALLDALKELKSEKAALEEERKAFQNFVSKSQDYVLTEISPHSFAFALKPAVRPEEPRHHVCVPCFEQQKVSLLQFEKRDFYFDTLKCPSCKTTVRAPNGNEPVISTVPRSRGGWEDLLG